jgi:hypothetical protein
VSDNGIFETETEPDPDRQRGILTSHDRRFLLEDSEVREDMKPEAIRQKRYKIRNRFRNGIADMQYLMRLDGDVAEIFSEEHWEDWDDFQLGAMQASVMTNFFLLARAFEGGRIAFMNFIEHMMELELQEKYAEDRIYLPEGSVELKLDCPDREECPSFGDLLHTLEQDESIPRTAHLVLNNAGMHPNPEDIPGPETFDGAVEDAREKADEE